MAGAWLPLQIASAIYQHVSPPRITQRRGLIRRNAVYLTAIFTSAFAFEIAYDSASNRIWDAMNRGRQWKDIKHQYMVKDEEDDE
ncbi:UQCRX/QCR9 like ubiquinol-cytochrome C reductase family protein [Aspergillus flavus]|nr:ubiquinol-cytochrome C reductase [Aspergillus flavus]RAQ43252.1 UQCRX/QCR9 like ubiquinol-cytochrome C reductase family protein [Aspergillus flavus]RAQ65667.1 UQCRX/QCR9 like ubiquinol-cytochrome C reductase family protein [Aspergillus flavus]